MIDTLLAEFRLESERHNAGRGGGRGGGGGGGLGGELFDCN